ncbi:MAG: flavin-dependent dehydrogenase, partial [Pseudomonadales bacterium]
MNDTVDAIIVGAGPAGLAAAAELAKHRLSVCLLDEQ